MFLLIGGFFLLVNYIGYGHITELRLVNILFVVIVSNLLARRNWIDDSGVEYVGNFLSVLTANIVNLVLCMVGFILYTSLFDPDYISTISSGLLWNSDSSLTQVLIALFFEGMASSVVVSFTVMQYWKSRRRQHHTIF